MTGQQWQGIPIEDMGDKRLSPYLRYDARTSEVAKGIANVTKELPFEVEPIQSPKRVEHIIKGYTGTWGKIGLGAIDQMAGKSNYNPATVLEKMEYMDKLKDVPGINSVVASFFTDAERATTIREQYYDKKEMYDRSYADSVKNGMKPNIDTYENIIKVLAARRKGVNDDSQKEKIDGNIKDYQTKMQYEVMRKLYNKTETKIQDMKKVRDAMEKVGTDRAKARIKVIDSAILGLQKGMVDISRRVENNSQKRK